MQLKPVLGPFQLIFYSIGVIVGAGVYSVLGAAAGLAQGYLWISFIIGALVAFLTAISYAEMTTSFPTAGAEYVYVRLAWPQADWLSFGIGVILLIGGSATAATVATAFGGYLQVFLDCPPILSAAILLAACTAFNAWGLRESSWVNILFTSIEIFGLLLVIVLAWLSDARTSHIPDVQPSIMAATALLFFVYLGFEEVANLSEETRNPARDIPIALFVSLAVTTCLYVAVSIAAIRLAQPADLASSAAPLAAALQLAWPGAAKILTAIALFATANTVLITMIATSRLGFSMARSGDMPTVLARVTSSRQTPWAAAVLALALAGVLLPVGSITILAELSSFAALTAFLAVNLVVIVLRYRRPSHTRPFRAAPHLGRMPIPPVLAIACIVTLLFYFDRKIYIAGAATLCVTALIYAIRLEVQRRRSHRLPKQQHLH